MMAESTGKCNGDVALEDIIDTKFEKILKLDCDLDSLRTKQHARLTKSLAVKELEISFTDELKLLCDTKAAIRSDIEIVSTFVHEKHEEAAKIQSAKEICEKQQLEEIMSYENTLKKGLPKFRNALRIYNDNYLMQEIEDIRNQRRHVEEKVESLDEQIQSLVSKYKLDKIGNVETPGKEAATTELSQLRQIWSSANLDRVSARKLYEYLNKELEDKVRLNERKKARFV